MTEESYRAGFVAIIGRPNAGKSTLVNALVDDKISIVTSKPQTTRHSILGILSRTDMQVVLVDTPGLHPDARKLINRTMNRAAVASLTGADLVLFLVEATGWAKGDNHVLQRLSDSNVPTLLVVNKTDLVQPKTALLPVIEDCMERGAFKEIIPVSARSGDNLDRLLQVIRGYLPESEPLFPTDATTDRSMKFRIGEIFREKLLEVLRDEVPYGLAVEINALEERPDLILVDAIIWVEKESHKGIVVGQQGERLKYMSTSARHEMESVFEKRFFLQSYVKVKENWSDNATALAQLGYEVPQ